MTVFLAMVAFLGGMASCLLPFSSLERKQIMLIDIAMSVVLSLLAHVWNAEISAVTSALILGRVSGIPTVCRGGTGLLLLFPSGLLFAFWPSLVAAIAGTTTSAFKATRSYREIVGLLFFICTAPFLLKETDPVWWSAAATAVLISTTIRIKKTLPL